MRTQDQMEQGDRPVPEPGSTGPSAQDSAELDEPLGHEDGPSKEAVPETD
ncbi:hypothetical protein [Arthrobacter mangrovi]|uniref:Uncharacterized protein n=1 Tax=Arthrobacter mangrovi TaxID=2966350 RepID=A0ABQ5MVD4_9MICC|nr:hypothetical protein [Arthrobacter mangrovi]GLB67750.1 hypothetical protein AHIS1636_21900 [Arthrobacter mangrovi]